MDDDALDIKILNMKNYARAICTVAADAISSDDNNEHSDMYAIMNPLWIALDRLHNELLKENK